MEGISADELLEEARAQIRRVTPSEAAAEVARGDALLVDLRTEHDRDAEGVIAGAVHIASSVLEWRAEFEGEATDERLVQGQDLLLVCNDGYSSSLKAANLKRLGHAGVGDIRGGFRAWKASGLPVETLDDPL